MKRTFFIALILLFSSAASAHPGKTDYQDGHTCQKNCEEWNLGYDEYHLHDKDRNPIRLGAKRKPIRELMPQDKAMTVQEPLPATPVPERTIHGDPQEKAAVQSSGQGKDMPVLEEGMLQLRDIALIVIAGLLFLVLLILRKRKQTEK
jgi:hypothetical protein